MKLFVVICMALVTTACSTITGKKSDSSSSQTQSLSANFHNTSPSFDVLFISANYDETITFQALMSELAQRGYSTKHAMLIQQTQPSGKKNKNVFTLKNHFEQVQVLNNIDTETNSQEKINKDSLKHPRYSFIPNNWLADPITPIDEKDIKIITASLNPKLVITGISHAVQAQLSNQFQAQNVPIIAMYNKLTPFTNQPGVQRWLRDANPVDEVFIPADILIDATHKLRPFQSSWITVTGMPALPKWKESVRSSNQKAIRRALNLDREKPTIVFLGDQDQYYNDNLTLLIQAIKERPDIQLVIQQNTNNAALEREILAKYNGTEHIRLVDKKWPNSSLVAIADMVIASNSFDGTLAALAQHPVLFISDTKKGHALIDHGLAMKANRWAELLNAIHKVIDQNVHATGSISPMGFPKRPIERTTNRIESIIKRTSNPLESMKIESIEVENSL